MTIVGLGLYLGAVDGHLLNLEEEAICCVGGEASRFLWCNILPYNVVCFLPGAPVELGATAIFFNYPKTKGVKETHEIITINFCCPIYSDLLLTLTVISNNVIITDWATKTGKQAIDVLCTHYHLHLE